MLRDPHLGEAGAPGGRRRIGGIDALVVEHTPKDDNRAHSDVFGDKSDPEVRLKLARYSMWLILPGGLSTSEI